MILRIVHRNGGVGGIWRILRGCVRASWSCKDCDATLARIHNSREELREKSRSPQKRNPYCQQSPRNVAWQSLFNANDPPPPLQMPCTPLEPNEMPRSLSESNTKFTSLTGMTGKPRVRTEPMTRRRQQPRTLPGLLVNSRTLRCWRSLLFGLRVGCCGLCCRLRCRCSLGLPIGVELAEISRHIALCRVDRVDLGAILIQG